MGDRAIAISLSVKYKTKCRTYPFARIETAIPVFQRPKAVRTLGFTSETCLSMAIPFCGICNNLSYIMFGVRQKRRWHQCGKKQSFVSLALSLWQSAPVLYLPVVLELCQVLTGLCQLALCYPQMEKNCSLNVIQHLANAFRFPFPFSD
jgi:hypothetical protein